MAAIRTTTSPSGAALIYRAVHFIEDAFEALVQWQERQETERVLSKLSSRQLYDIGIERCDIARVSSSSSR